MDITDLNYNQAVSRFEIGNEQMLMWAHPNELLHEHINKTKLLFHNLMDEDLIKHFYEYFKAQNYLNIDYDLFKEILNKMLDFHDSAKISFNFQLKRLKNHNILKTLKKYELDKFVDLIEIKHSYVSSLLYFSFLTDQLDLKNNIITLLFSYIIYGHHTSLKDILNQEEFVWNDNDLSEETFYLFYKYYFGKNPENIDLDLYRDFQGDLYNFLKKHQDSVVSFFYSYLYSLLVTSDVIASSYSNKDAESVKNYSKNWNNRINEEIINAMEQKFYELDHNKKCKEISSEDLLSEDEINSLSKINDLRTEMLKEASFNLTKSLKMDPDKKIFYLNMPTGGGKTNTSMKLALDILENTNVNRVIYAMPFINIIEQNYDIIKANFGLNEDKGEIRKIYSASESIFSDISDDDKSEIILKDSFFDYPVLCTTFVALFNSIIKNKKRYKYAISALANSIIILDEIQSLPLKNWTSLYYLINELSKNYNIYFIIMSATLPNFDKLKLNKEAPFDYETVHLINKPNKYFSHYLFDRTELKNEITELNTEDEDFSFYFEDILDENFQIGYNKGLIVLNTIKMSKLVYNELHNLKEEYKFEIDLLNSSIIPAEKREIIHKINNMDSDNTRYVLVSTQSVEAGVDVSFDFVIRDFATLDSIEQIRGRCNRSREINKRFCDENKKGNVYITNIKRNNKLDHRYIYDKEEIDTRIKETEVSLENNLNYNYKSVLNYYELVSSNINHVQDDKETNFIFKDRDNINSWNTLKFSELLDKDYGIHIIQKKNNQYSFFVATKLNILIDNKEFQNKSIETMSINTLSKLYENDMKNFIFTLNEIKYLKAYENKYNVALIKDNSVNGVELIKCYDKCIKKFKKDIGAKIIIQKEFSSILYKFIFQVTSNDFDDLIETQELDKVGYFYVIPERKIGSSENCIYSMENGFNFEFMKNENDSVEIL